MRLHSDYQLKFTMHHIHKTVSPYVTGKQHKMFHASYINMFGVCRPVYITCTQIIEYLYDDPS